MCGHCCAPVLPAKDGVSGKHALFDVERGRGGVFVLNGTSGACVAWKTHGEGHARHLCPVPGRVRLVVDGPMLHVAVSEVATRRRAEAALRGRLSGPAAARSRVLAALDRAGIPVDVPGVGEHAPDFPAETCS